MEKQAIQFIRKLVEYKITMQYSVVNYKNVKENSDFRIDADYYYPEFLRNEKLLIKRKVVYFDKDFVDIKFGTTPKGAHFQESGIPFVRSQNFSNGFIDGKDLVYIKKEDHLKQIKSKLILKDILIAAVGATIGEVVFSTIDEGNTNQNIARVRVKSKNIYPEFLFAFLKSKYGQYQLGKLNTGNAQAYLNSPNIASLFTVELAKSFQEKIQELITSSYKKINQSKSLYSQAEQLLLSELGLLDWKHRHELAFVKNFFDTKESNRFDAEFFQPKYEEIVEAVKKYKGGFDTIAGQFKQNKKSFKKILDKEYQYIEIGCINISDGSMEPMKLQGYELPANAKIKFQKGDVIVSKVRPYRGAIGIVDSEDFVGSGAFTVLQENGVVNKETLMVFLRLKPLLDFSLKFNTGTSYPTITDEDILNFPLPKIDSKTQEEIKKKITEMYETKKLSKSLLEIAKRGVEKAIEKDEREAEKWIEEKLKEIKIGI